MVAHELYLLHLGQLKGDGRNFNQVAGYLIRTATGRTVLVDTGNPAVLIGAADAQPWSDLVTNVLPEDDVVSRLAELQIAPADVDLLISTHFDFDHCGRHDAFAAVGTESIVQRRQLDEARASPRFDARLWDFPGLNYRVIDGDLELEQGLRLIETSGHALGHQSVFVETTAGPVILAIDAISAGYMIPERDFPAWYSDIDETNRSIDRLVALAAETGAFLLFGHDVAQWNTLPKSPEPFRRPAE